jgi:protein-tyrosine phosphatase
VETRAFVDCHSHVVPSGDDGAQTLAEGLELCRGGAEHGTGVLFATPHVWPQLVLTAERERAIREALAKLAARAPLELRLGFELTPAPPLLDEDPRRYELEGTGAVLVEMPFVGSSKLLYAVAEHVEAAGLRPVIAHPERTETVLADPAAADRLSERGWLVQVNATSLLGRHGAGPAEAAWQLVEADRVSLVASDGHRTARPPQLDAAYELVRARVGEERALRLFDGSALGVVASSRPIPSRAAAQGA